MRLIRVFRFEAAHRLISPQLDDEANVRVYGKCARPGGHGHNDEVEVVLEGRPDPRTGMLLQRRELDRRVQERLLDRVDHRDLNAVVDDITTGENLARIFHDWLAPAFTDGPRLLQVRVKETPRNRFETIGGR